MNKDAYTNNGGANSHDFVDYNGTVISSPYIEDVSGVANSAQLSIADTDGVFTEISLVNGTVGKYLKFKVVSVPATGANGVLSVKDASGVIMWSWHIWLWADDLSPVEITNNTGVKYSILPVNLASKWDDTTKTKIKNWFYQFGRPTPLLCPSTYNSSSNHASFGALGYYKDNCASDINIGIQNPTTFYKNSSPIYNWFSTDYKIKDNLWDAACISRGSSDNNVVKTVYDPSPIGFKIPNGNTFSGFSKTNTIGSFSNGWTFKRNSNDTVGVFFPASMERLNSSGDIYNYIIRGCVWSSAIKSDSNIATLQFDSDSVKASYDYAVAGGGFSVRPVTDEPPKMPLENGVYIQAVDGTLYTESEWDGSKTPNGIAVKTDNCEFVIALQDGDTPYLQWGGYEKTVSSIVTTTDKSAAQTDYAGYYNTYTIITELYGYNASNVNGAPAAEYCASFMFPNGKDGYLGAAGEWQAALDNKIAITSALSKCGGTAISDYYWTSTQYDSEKCWYVLWSNKTLSTHFKFATRNVRAFTSL